MYFHHGKLLLKTQGHLPTYTTPFPKESICSFMPICMEYTKVKTATMEKIPMVTPKSERVVRRRLLRRACHAKRILSKSCRRNFIVQYDFGKLYLGVESKHYNKEMINRFYWEVERLNNGKIGNKVFDF